jgi:hypothetical protein
MGKISSYSTVTPPVSGSDMLIGTDVSTNNATKNFTVNQLAEFISEELGPGPQGPPGPTGATGATGAPGAPGVPGMVWTGDWDADNDYDETSVVYYLGSSYIALDFVDAGGDPPNVDPLWDLVAQKGADAPPGTAGWSLTGNAGTNPSTNFIGTTDLNNFYFKANNLEFAYLDTSTNWFRFSRNVVLYNDGLPFITTSSDTGGQATLRTDVIFKGHLELRTGTYTTKLHANQATLDRVLALPNGGGTMPLTVNGIGANLAGNINLPVVTTTKVSLTAAQLQNIGTGQEPILPAPGAGKIYNILKATYRYNYNSVAYNNVGIYLVYGDTLATNATNTLSNFINATNNRIGFASFFAGNSDGLINTDILIEANGVTGTGNGTLDVYVTYEIITL